MSSSTKASRLAPVGVGDLDEGVGCDGALLPGGPGGERLARIGLALEAGERHVVGQRRLQRHVELAQPGGMGEEQPRRVAVLLRQALESEVGSVAVRPWAIDDARLPGREGLWRIALRGGLIAAIRPQRAAGPSAGPIVSVHGRVVLPGLHDAHLHVMSAARELTALTLSPSLRGWPAVADEITTRAATVPVGWLSVRRFDHDEMTRGWIPDRCALDAVCPTRPLRLRHRNLRLDVLNTPALAACGLLEDPPGRQGVECDAAGHPTGRLHQASAIVRRAQGAAAWSPATAVAAFSRELLRHGVTAIQDAGEHNGHEELAALDELARCGHIRQRLWTMVSGRLIALERPGRMGSSRIRHAKLVAVEAQLDVDELCAQARAARRAGLRVAVHATTEVELAAAVAAIGAANAAPAAPGPGCDRVEHAFVAGAGAPDAVAGIGAAVVASPALIQEHGDRYLAEHAPESHHMLHRVASWRAAGVPVALASDAPVASASPQVAMAAAVDRRTASGARFGADERLDGTEAIRAMTEVPARLIGERRLGRLAPGHAADLIAVDGPVTEVHRGPVALTVLRGEIVHAAADVETGAARFEPAFAGG